MKSKIFLLVFILNFSLVIGVEAQLYCDINASCDVNEVDMLHLNNTDDSHAELPSESNAYFQYKLCCGGVDGLNNTIQGVQGTDYDVFLKLWNASNSHVQQSNESGYNNHPEA